MSERGISFVTLIATRFPGLAAVLSEHIKENFGEVLPHVFFGDLARYVVSLVLATNSGGGLAPRRELHEILNLLEETFVSGEEGLRELIAGSFLENLPRPDEEGSKVLAMLGP